MITNNAKKICDAVVNDWKPEYDFEVEHFKLPLSKNDFFNTTYSTLGNITINEYLKSLTGGSSYRYATFKRRSEILISHGKVRNLCFQKLENTIILNALSQIDSDISKSVSQFINDKDNTFDSTAWADYLLSSGQILGAMEADEIFLFSTLCYIRNIISFYGLLPFQVEFSIDDDCIFFYCVDFNNNKFTYFVSLTNPLASHFLKEI